MCWWRIGTRPLISLHEHSNESDMSVTLVLTQGKNAKIVGLDVMTGVRRYHLSTKKNLKISYICILNAPYWFFITGLEKKSFTYTVTCFLTFLFCSAASWFRKKIRPRNKTAEKLCGKENKVRETIKCSTSTFLSNVGHITHTCTKHYYITRWQYSFTFTCIANS